RDVPRAAGCRIVAGVAYEERTVAAFERGIDAPVGVAGRGAERELRARVPVSLGQAARLERRRAGVGPRHDDRGAAARLVRPGVPDPDRGVDDPLARLDRRKPAVDRPRWLVARARPLAGQEDRHSNPGPHGSYASLEARDEIR